MDRLTLWQRYKQYLCESPSVGVKLDISRIHFPDDYMQEMQPRVDQALSAMAALESGEIANPDEKRMVGHYWLRAADLAPTAQIRQEIEATLADVKAFAADVHSKKIAPPNAPKFTDMLLIGIGGSALGPQLVADALGNPGNKRDKIKVHYFDNTDPDGMERTLIALGSRLKSTLVVVVSKSGGTKETRNGMLEAEAHFKSKGLNFSAHTVAITSQGSLLDQHAQKQGWLKRFPMWDWVGGRTSVMSAVGLVPMALQGVDIQALLDGAAEMDRVTRQKETGKNPAALLAIVWRHATGGRGAKDMVMLPYKDRLLLLSRYLQQLVMESLGKEVDLSNQVVNQGIAVYGNKGSTDQHAYVQQLRDGVNNFFVTFIVVMRDRVGAGAGKPPLEVDPGFTSGDYLNGFWQGTREALYEKDRGSVTITLDKIDARSLGAVIALYERTVGFYATLVNINAYHQPGVEAGKKAAESVLDIQRQVVAYLKTHPEAATPEQIADRSGVSQQVETVNHVLEHLAANKRGVASSRGKFAWKG
jgi:glucose-6-phosphate isomerase